MAKNEDMLPVLAFESQEAWEVWLETHQDDAAGLWLKIAKQGAAAATISYAQALDAALCFGWIDGQKRGLDTAFWLQKFTPRREKSAWSRVNREKATALIAAERMRPAGLRQVELARADGRWEAAYASQRTIEVPEDFQRALDEHPDAAAFFATLNSANRYAFLYRIQTAKRPATRAANIQRFIGMLERGEQFHP